jgi:endonuclease V-like protein UPF0215 family
VKSGARALGIAESAGDETSTLAGAVVRADRVVDGVIFDRCTVGGDDATAAVCRLVDRIDREDISYCVLAGIAPAWFNLFDLARINEATGLSVLSVSFEASPGLEAAIRDAFDEQEAIEQRLATYQRQPARTAVHVNDERVFVRASGLQQSEARDVIKAFTPEGGWPEPLRVAKAAARAGERLRTRVQSAGD